MASKEELIERIKQGKSFVKMLVNGGFGTGKTYFSMTFPKWAYAMIEPNGIQTAITNKPLLENMVDYEDFAPKADEDIKETFKRLSEYIVRVRKLIAEGRVETFILDNLTHLSQARWMYINKYEKQTAKSGETDTRAMYGALSSWLTRFILTEVVTLPCHVVVPVHEMDEKDDQGKDTGKIITNTLGGFRNDAAGFFNASIHLTCKKEGAGYKYTAQCLPSFSKPAKNNIGLPEIVTDISWTTIKNSIGKAITA